MWSGDKIGHFIQWYCLQKANLTGISIYCKQENDTAMEMSKKNQKLSSNSKITAAAPLGILIPAIVCTVDTRCTYFFLCVSLRSPLGFSRPSLPASWELLPLKFAFLGWLRLNSSSSWTISLASPNCKFANESLPRLRDIFGDAVFVLPNSERNFWYRFLNWQFYVFHHFLVIDHR